MTLDRAKINLYLRIFARDLRKGVDLAWHLASALQQLKLRQRPGHVVHVHVAHGRIAISAKNSSTRGRGRACRRS